MKRSIHLINPATVRQEMRQLMIISSETGEVKRVPIEDMDTLVLVHPQILISHQTLRACAEEGVAVVFSGQDFHPISISLPFAGHTLHTKILRQQSKIKEPLRKQAWQQTVMHKISNQAGLLKDMNAPIAVLNKYAKSVRSDDADNLEARAAKYYWKHFLDEIPFSRERFGNWPNPLLNYTYAVYRASLARAVVGAGLHPALGFHHKNQYNAFSLVDDLIEPYRPYADRAVLACLAQFSGEEELTTAVKRFLIASLQGDVKIRKQMSPLLQAMKVSAQSYVKFIFSETDKIIYPEWHGVNQ
ncbi:MAG: type II CRISPR-associated endonuclease Cas1 [Bacteroidia bacterium]